MLTVDNGDVQLMQSELLIVFYEGIWGTVCMDGFSSQAAELACSLMGFSSGTAQGVQASSLTDVAIPPILSNVECAGVDAEADQNFYNCYHDAWGEADCEEIVSLECVHDEVSDPYSVCSIHELRQVQNTF